MKILIILPLLGLWGCGAKHGSIHYGKTTSASLILERGKPLDKSNPAKNIEIYEYPENEKFQIKNDVVTHGFRDPKGDERTLLYWKHKFKNCEAINKKINQGKGHVVPEYELKCSSQGVTVVYSEGSEFVSRVLEYEKE